MKKKTTSCLVKALSYPKRENMALFSSSGTSIPLLSVQLESHCYTGRPTFWADAYYNRLDWRC